MADTPTQKQPILFIDVVKAFAILLVVIIHVAAPSLYKLNALDRFDWWIANIADSIARPGVPLFLLVSGLLLLDPVKEETLGTFFRKRVLKVGVPLIIWSFVYLAFRAIVQDQELTVKGVVNDLLTGNTYYHLGFFYYLMGLYLATPILRVYIKAATRGNLTYFIVLWLFVIVAQYLRKFTDFALGIQFTVAVGYSGYYILGDYLRETKIQTRKQLFTALTVWLVSAVVTAVGNYQLTVDNGGTHDGFFYGYLSLNVVLMAICLFLFVKSLPYDRIFARYPVVRSVTLGLGRQSFGIYLVHPIILHLLFWERYGPLLAERVQRHPVIGIPGIVIVVTVLSFGLVLVIRRLPLGKIIIP